MSYYPIISAPGCLGRTTLFNYPPNDWESKSKPRKLVNLTWSHHHRWHSLVVDDLAFGAAKSYQYSDFSAYLPEFSLPLLSLTTKPLPDLTELLPISSHITHIPSWRATIELFTSHSSTSYQGELDPFPAPGSLLSFSPLLQIADSLQNFVLLLNLERSPIRRTSALRIFNSISSPQLLGEFEIASNAVTSLCLDNLGLTPQHLPVTICTEMSAIPLFLSMERSGACLSLEHSHPPASYVVHGRRWEAQRFLKSRWFSRLLRK
jgi:hypothetical protein